MTNAETESLRRLLGTKKANDHLDQGEIVDLIDRSLSDAELEDVKNLVRTTFGAVAVETAEIGGAPLLIWRQIAQASPTPAARQ